MYTIHSIEEMIELYVRLGGRAAQTGRGVLYQFDDENGTGSIHVMGNLRQFSYAKVDFVCPADMVVRAQYCDRYIGISLGGAGQFSTYRQKDQTRLMGEGMDCFVSISRSPYFVRTAGGQLLICYPQIGQ